jgi:predicted nucleotidyltransferase
MLSKSQISILSKKYDLDLLILFGSHAKKTARRESDLDIAYLSKNELSQVEEEEFISQLMEISGIHDIDLIDLKKNHDPLLQYQIFVKGTCLFESHPQFFNQKRNYSMGRYWDCSPFFEDLGKLLDKKLNTFTNA